MTVEPAIGRRVQGDLCQFLLDPLSRGAQLLRAERLRQPVLGLPVVGRRRRARSLSRSRRSSSRARRSRRARVDWGHLQRTGFELNRATLGLRPLKVNLLAALRLERRRNRSRKSFDRKDFGKFVATCQNGVGVASFRVWQDGELKKLPKESPKNL